MYPLLIAGTAPDGPAAPTLVQSLTEATALYFGARAERFSVTPTMTEATLAADPWQGRVQAFEENADGTLTVLAGFGAVAHAIGSDWVLDPAPLGRSVYFEPFGRSLTLVLVYRTAPDDRDLLDQIRQVYAGGYAGPIVAARIAGAAAAGALGGVRFTGRYPGSRYNGVAMTLTPWAAVPANEKDTTHPKTWRFTVTTPAGWTAPPMAPIDCDTADELSAAVATQADRGRCPVHAVPDPTTGILTAGTAALAGGADDTDDLGRDSLACLADLLADDPGEFRVIGLSGWAAADVAAILTAPGTDGAEAIDDWAFPSFAVLSQSTLDSGGNPIGSAALAAAPIPTHGRIMLTCGRVRVDFPEGPAWMSMGPTYAALLATDAPDRSGTTGAPLAFGAVDPAWTLADLETLAAAGRVVPGVSIPAGPCIYAGVPSSTVSPQGAATWDLPVWRVYQRLAARFMDRCADLVGMPFDAAVVGSRLSGLFDGVPGVVTLQMSADWQPTLGVLTVTVTFQPVGELTSVTVALSLRL